MYILATIKSLGLDYSDTFRNHPCPTSNTTEKNYTLCFVTCTLFALASMGVVLKFNFPQPAQQHRTDEVNFTIKLCNIRIFDIFSMTSGLNCYCILGRWSCNGHKNRGLQSLLYFHMIVQNPLDYGWFKIQYLRKLIQT